MQKDELGMCCPLGYLGRRCRAGSRLLDGEGGSAATELAGARVLGALGFGFRRNRVRVCAQVQSEARQGQREAVRRCRVSAMAERRRRNAGTSVLTWERSYVLR